MPVAVKTMKTISKSQLMRFRSEVIMLSQLKHPNIVELRGILWGPTLVGLAMELMTNGNLSDALHNPVLSLSWADPMLRMALDISSGMEYLHSREYFDDQKKAVSPCVIHRDLKPANMMLTPTFSIKLTDFGEARGRDMDATMTSVGTPLYLAPEVVKGDRYDEKVGRGVYGWLVVGGDICVHVV